MPALRVTRRGGRKLRQHANWDPEGTLLVATQSQLEILVYSPKSTGVKDTASSPLQNPYLKFEISDLRFELPGIAAGTFDPAPRFHFSAAATLPLTVE
jgi:hypothetical protein